MPSSFISTWESLVSGSFALELDNVESSGKDPDAAWDDAVAAAKKVLTKRGVLS